MCLFVSPVGPCFVTGCVCARWILTSHRVLDAVGSVALPPLAPLDAIVVPLAEVDARLEPLSSSVTFLKDVSTDKLVRDASLAASQQLSEHGVKARMRMVAQLILRSTLPATVVGDAAATGTVAVAGDG